MTAAWMKTRETEYAPWLPGPVDTYVANQVLPVDAEIDHVGLTALKDVLLSPAGIFLEVLYLDRTEGSEVTMHRFDPVAAGGFTVGTLRLLYRPYASPPHPHAIANPPPGATMTFSTNKKTFHRRLLNPPPCKHISNTEARNITSRLLISMSRVCRTS
jgi:ubiquitin thioesterase protein OTUB1